MPVPTSYFTSTKNTSAILHAMQRAGVPDKFTFEFLKQLGFASSTDRPVIPVLKSLGFLNDGAVPTERYRQFKDKGIAKAILAQGVREGYADVFAIDTEANGKSIQELQGIFARLSDKGSSVTDKMATTFKTLASLADFSSGAGVLPADEKVKDEETPSPPPADPPPSGGESATNVLTLRHDVHVHLPLSTDVAVYDAIFKGLKANLL
jgi:hypothetical protein